MWFMLIFWHLMEMGRDHVRVKVTNLSKFLAWFPVLMLAFLRVGLLRGDVAQVGTRGARFVPFVVRVEDALALVLIVAGEAESSLGR